MPDQMSGLGDRSSQFLRRFRTAHGLNEGTVGRQVAVKPSRNRRFNVDSGIGDVTARILAGAIADISLATAADASMASHVLETLFAELPRITNVTRLIGSRLTNYKSYADSSATGLLSANPNASIY